MPCMSICQLFSKNSLVMQGPVFQCVLRYHHVKSGTGPHVGKKRSNESTKVFYFKVSPYFFWN